MINRSLIIVRAKAPFLNWLKSLPDPINLTLDQLNQDNKAYLVQEIESDKQREKILEHYFPLIVEEQLSGWWTDEGDWPEIEDLKVFREWFDVEIHSVVIDLLDEKIVDAE